MQHFHDLLLGQELDYGPQIIGIEGLLHHTGLIESPYHIISECFLTWIKKRNYTCLQDLQQQSGIMDIIRRAHNHEEISKEEFIYYLEYVLLILEIPSQNANKSYVIMGYAPEPVLEQVKFAITEIGCQIVKKNGGYYIIEENAKVEIAAKITGKQYDLDADMRLYNHPAVRNKLTAKADILCRLYKYLEQRAEGIKKNNFASLYGDISKLMDSLDIRHAPSKKEKEILAGMSKKEITQWYDQLFGMCVSLIILVDYAEKRRDIKELKNALG